jgi:hypothetical protein
MCFGCCPLRHVCCPLRHVCCPLRHVCQAKHSCQGGVLAAVPLVGSVAGWEGGQPSRCCLVIFVNTDFVRNISSRAAVCLYYSQLGGAVCLHMWPDCHCILSWRPLGSNCASIKLRHCPWWRFLWCSDTHRSVGQQGDSASGVAHASTCTYLQRCRPYYMSATPAALLMCKLLGV